jgi:hypothetical protein
MKTTKVTLPTFLASALINGDLSGLDDNEDMGYYEQALQLAQGGTYIDVSEDSWFSWTNDLPGKRFGADVAEYTILWHT